MRQRTVVENNDLDDIRDVIATLEFTASGFKGELSKILSEFANKTSVSSDMFVELSGLGKKINAELSKYKDIEDAKIIPKKEYKEIILLLKTIQRDFHVVFEIGGHTPHGVNRNANTEQLPPAPIDISSSELLSTREALERIEKAINDMPILIKTKSEKLSQATADKSTDKYSNEALLLGGVVGIFLGMVFSSILF